MDLVYKHEKILFAVSVILSTLIWAAVSLATGGLALIILLLVMITHTALQARGIAAIRGTGARISEAQFPDLHQRIVDCCSRVGITKLPSAYLLPQACHSRQATRFFGRHFIVLSAAVVDALASQPGAINFYIGQELAKLRRNHHKWDGFIFPALLLPLLGAAYRRACVYTRDRHGVACCETDNDICAALALQAAGATRWQAISQKAFLRQTAVMNGFWMSFYELISDVPWLIRRMATAMALRNSAMGNHSMNHGSTNHGSTHNSGMGNSLFDSSTMANDADGRLPRRHRLAWLAAALVPGIRPAGVLGPVIAIVAMVVYSVWANAAMTMFEHYAERARLTPGVTSRAAPAAAPIDATAEASDIEKIYRQALPITRQVAEYHGEHATWPDELRDLGFAANTIYGPGGSYEISLGESGQIRVKTGTDPGGAPRYLQLVPKLIGDDITWTCRGQNLTPGQLPPACR